MTVIGDPKSPTKRYNTKNNNNSDNNYGENENNNDSYHTKGYDDSVDNIDTDTLHSIINPPPFSNDLHTYPDPSQSTQPTQIEVTKINICHNCGFNQSLTTAFIPVVNTLSPDSKFQYGYNGKNTDNDENANNYEKEFHGNSDVFEYLHSNRRHEVGWYRGR